MARTKSFFLGGLKFNFACVKNNYNYERKYFECVSVCRVCNISGSAKTPDTCIWSLECDLDLEHSVVQDIFSSCYIFKTSLIKFNSVPFK